MPALSGARTEGLGKGMVNMSLLTEHDDLFVHQSQHVLAQPATTDMRFFERCYFNVHDQQGEFSMCIGLGSYPNLNTMDGFAVGVTENDPQQHNARFFRELHGDPTRLEVGALHLDIVEPMRRWRLRMDANAYDIDFELEMQARFAPWDARLHATHEGVLVFDYATFVQAVTYRGRIRIGERTIESDDLVGCRDRSFGLRPVGGIPMPAGASRPFGSHYWLNPQFEDSAYFVLYTENNDGDQISIDGGIAGGKYDGRRFVALEHDLTLRDGIRVHREGVMRLTDDTGHVHELRTQAALPGIYLLGAGYFSKQGKPLGDHEEGEKFDVASDDPDVLRHYLADSGADQPALYTLSETGEQGYGMLEISFGPHLKKYRANDFQ
jgi:hypothetical protein